MPRKLPADPSQALARVTRVVGAYTDPDIDGAAEVEAVLDEIGRDKAELRDLVASLGSLAAHAVTVLSENSSWSESELFPWQRRAKALHQMLEISQASSSASTRRSWDEAVAEPTRPTTIERRSGFDRRRARDRRFRSPGNPVEQVIVRRDGDRRHGPADRRSGVERRGARLDSLS